MSNFKLWYIPPLHLDSCDDDDEDEEEEGKNDGNSNLDSNELWHSPQHTEVSDEKLLENSFKQLKFQDSKGGKKHLIPRSPPPGPNKPSLQHEQHVKGIPSEERNIQDPLRGVRQTDHTIRHKEVTSSFRRDTGHHQMPSTSLINDSGAYHQPSTSLINDSGAYHQPSRLLMNDSGAYQQHHNYQSEISDSLSNFVTDQPGFYGQQTQIPLNQNSIQQPLMGHHSSGLNADPLMQTPQLNGNGINGCESDHNGSNLIARIIPYTSGSQNNANNITIDQNHRMPMTISQLNGGQSSNFALTQNAQQHPDANRHGQNLIVSQSSGSSLLSENGAYENASNNQNRSCSSPSNSTSSRFRVNRNVLSRLRDKVNANLWRKGNIEALINPNTHPNRDSALIIAVRQGDLSKLDKLIKLYSQNNMLMEQMNFKNVTQETALSIAVHQNNQHAIEKLIFCGCDATIPLLYGSTVCHVAVMKDCETALSQPTQIISSSCLLHIISTIESTPSQKYKLQLLMNKRDSFGQTVEDILNKTLFSLLKDSPPYVYLHHILAQWQLKLRL